MRNSKLASLVLASALLMTAGCNNESDWEDIYQSGSQELSYVQNDSTKYAVPSYTLKDFLVIYNDQVNSTFNPFASIDPNEDPENLDMRPYRDQYVVINSKDELIEYYQYYDLNNGFINPENEIFNNPDLLVSEYQIDFDKNTLILVISLVGTGDHNELGSVEGTHLVIHYVTEDSRGKATPEGEGIHATLIKAPKNEYTVSFKVVTKYGEKKIDLEK